VTTAGRDTVDTEQRAVQNIQVQSAKIKFLPSGRNSMVECQLPKLEVAGSSPVARSKFQPFRNHRMQVRNKKRADVAGAFFV
jgi:hypothetical protein